MPRTTRNRARGAKPNSPAIHFYIVNDEEQIEPMTLAVDTPLKIVYEIYCEKTGRTTNKTVFTFKTKVLPKNGKMTLSNAGVDNGHLIRYVA